MPTGLTLNGVFYSTEKLASWTEAQESRPLTENERNTLTFCRQWLTDQPDFLVRTSGSTGAPKPIRLTREQMTASARLTGRALGLSPGDRTLVCLPTRYIAGRMMLVRGLVLNLDLMVVEPASDPFALLPPMEEVDFTAVVPLQLQTLLNGPSRYRTILDGMKAILVGGAPVSLALQEQLQAIRAPVYHTYGMTETATHVALRRLNGPGASDFFAPLPDVHLGLDRRGCLTIRGPMTAGKTLATNDRVLLNADGSFRWLGRVDNVINSGGVKVQVEPVENVVERAFREMDGPELTQRRFFIAGLPDERLGQAVALILEGDPLPEETLIAVKTVLSARLERYSAPREICFVERFAETPTGKIDRRRTVQQLLGNQE